MEKEDGDRGWMYFLATSLVCGFSWKCACEGEREGGSLSVWMCRLFVSFKGVEQGQEGKLPALSCCDSSVVVMVRGGSGGAIVKGFL